MKKPAKSPIRKPDKTPFSIRLDKATREALAKAGEAEDRPAAYIAQRLIVLGLKAAGFLK